MAWAGTRDSGADPHRARFLGRTHRWAQGRCRRLSDQAVPSGRVGLAHPGPVAPRPWAGQPEPAGGRRAAPGRAASVRVPERRRRRPDRRRIPPAALFHAAPRPGPVQGAPGRASVRRRDRTRFQRHRGPRQPPAAQARPRGDRDPPWPGLPLRRAARRMRSIQRRLSVGLFAVLLVVGLVLAQTGLWLFDQGLRRYFAGNLREEAENLLVAMVRGPNGMQLDEQRLNPAFQRPYSGRYYVIELEKVTWRSRSLWDSELEVPHKKGLVQGLVDGPEEQRLLVFRGHYKRMGQKLRIVVAQDYTPILESFARVQWMGLGAGALALLLVLLLQRLTVRRSLRPLEEVRLQIAQLQQGQRSQLDNQAPEELEPLVEQINHLLAHTEETLKRSRNALGNLGHALKTPLAVLVSLAEREEMARQPELQQVLREQLEQIQQRLGRELGKARLVGEALPGAHFDCAEELPSLCDTLRLIHGPHLQVSWSAPPGLRLPWDREDLLEMLGNLLDNACKWADSEVRLTVAQGEGMVRLKVDDDGPGILPDQRQAVLERGTRLDEQVSGHGLGLGIARDIAEACGGRLSLEDSPLGGLRVSVELPLQKSGRAARA
ncbi:two-component sensor [Pseudomonas aeruginosa]|nr:two-component sensor [Pseudomonas aeruginosa]